MTRSRLWTAGTVAVVALLFIAGWFVLISPKLATASDTREQTVDVAQANQSTKAKIKQLEADQKDLPGQIARIETIREQIPESPRLPQLIRMVNGAAVTRSLELKSVAPGAVSELPGVEGVSYVPVEVVVHGHFSELKAYMADLEPTDPQLKDRAWLVSGFKVAEYKAEEGEDEVEDPDRLTLTLTARVFMATEIVPEAGATGAATGAAAPSAGAAGGSSSSNAN